MATEKSSESSKDNTGAGASGKPKIVAPDLLKDIKGKNTTRDEIKADQRFL